MKVSYDGTNLHFHATGASLKSVNAPKAFWHLVEIEYNAAGISRFWVNSDAVVNLNNPTDTFPTPGAGAVTAVRLGLPNGAANFTGVAQFDSYESHSTTPVGPLIVCDANDSKGGVPVNTLDVVAILDERYQQILAKGQPDCNFDGAVNTLDVVKALEIRYGN